MRVIGEYEVESGRGRYLGVLVLGKVYLLILDFMCLSLVEGLVVRVYVFRDKAGRDLWGFDLFIFVKVVLVFVCCFFC